MSKQTEDEKLAIRQKLKIALSGAGVEQALADKFLRHVERLQSDDDSLFAPEVLVIGEQLIALHHEVEQSARRKRRDIVAEMSASVLRVERVS